MADEERGPRWWVRYAAVPILSGGGLAALIVTLLFSHVLKPAAPDAKSALEVCPEVSRMLAPAECAYLRRLAGQAATGVGAFNAPSPMVVGQPATVVLAIGQAVADPVATAARPPTPADKAASAGRETPTPKDVVATFSGRAVEFQPVVGRFMTARLEGDGFEITPDTPVQKELPEGSLTTWQWRIVPRDPGPRALVLTTTVRAVTQSREDVTLRSTTKVVTVDVLVSTPGGHRLPASRRPAIVPAVIGLSPDEAARRLQAAGLRVVVEAQQDRRPIEGAVADQSPRAGAEVAVGQMVMLRMEPADPPPPMTMPSPGPAATPDDFPTTRLPRAAVSDVRAESRAPVAAGLIALLVLVVAAGWFVIRRRR